MNKRKKTIILICMLIIAVPFLINTVILSTTKKQIEENIENIKPADAALLLGARTYKNDKVSQIVYDRIIKAVELYKAGKVKKILVSGDHGTVGYDEVNTIKKWLLDNSVKEEDIFMDHAGFSTYESIYRAKEIFNVNSLVIVTQKFHLPRAVFISNIFKIINQGYIADRIIYSSRVHNNIREFLARNKDFMFSVFIKPKPTYLGDELLITGDGRITQD